MVTVLDVVDVSVAFGPVRAVNGVSLNVGEGEIVGLVGSNGAGKTTLIDAICGFVPSSGKILLNDANLSGRAPHIRTRAGLVRTFQSLELFEDLTVRENLNAAGKHSKWWSVFVDTLRTNRSADLDPSVELLRKVGLEINPDVLPTELSHGSRKLVSVARALSCNPKLLLLDEPAAGLDSTESNEFGDRLKRIRSNGVPILLVDHDMGLVSAICDRIYALEFGKVIAEGTPQEVLNNPRVVAAYLGSGEGDGGS